MHIIKILNAISLTASMALLAGAPAQAAGCNGVVSPAEWGCAPWDNNNGPKFPHYRAPAKSSTPAPLAAQQQAPQVRAGGDVNGFISHNGGGIVAQGAGNRQGGNGIVAQGGGN